MWARGKVAARRFEKGYFLCTFSLLLAETQCGGAWSGLLTSAARLPVPHAPRRMSRTLRSFVPGSYKPRYRSIGRYEAPPWGYGFDFYCLVFRGLSSFCSGSSARPWTCTGPAIGFSRGATDLLFSFHVFKDCVAYLSGVDRR